MIGTEGVICVLKPPGMSSSDAVTDIRRVLNEKRVGHTGTLDPAAAGVLPILVGRATRLFDFLVDKQKEYIAEIVFGKATDTEDATGEVTSVSDIKIGEAALKAALPAFIGEVEQTPPVYSALNVNGEKLYKLARKGRVTETPEIKKRRITVYELELMRQTGENSFLIRIVCSKGTYIRTLCKDIGDACGCPAYMGFLLRTRSGAFRLEDAYSIAEIAELFGAGRIEEAVIPMDRATEHIPELRLEGLSEKNKNLLIHGAGISVGRSIADCPHRIYLDGEFLGFGENIDGKLTITIWLGDEAHQLKGMKLEGKVEEERHVGRKLGFPTANLTGYDRRQLPSEGVYATIACLEDRAYPAVTSIGRNPTFGAEKLTVETHIMGFDGNCYGKRLVLRFLKKLRPMIRFDSVSELKAQIARDAALAEKLAADSKYTENI
ncbi:MAG: tRNA pseudouridine(55) synthase TruB [Clostridia bacterium]|nr:tRNA pseudouridine(55) synthase TruB [Clostridia bacterium]